MILLFVPIRIRRLLENLKAQIRLLRTFNRRLILVDQNSCYSNLMARISVRLNDDVNNCDQM